jgi:hypothetical protein
MSRAYGDPEDDWDTDDAALSDDDDEGAWDDDEPPLVRCPYCAAEMLELSPQCPSCGRYVSEEDRPAQRPGWLVVMVVVCLLITLAWTAIGL